ncbi:MAG: ribosome maturation factor RimM [Bellilinea sp.]
MKKRRAQPETPEQDQTGSPPLGEPVFLVIGLLGRSHGLKGDVIMDVYTDFPERLTPGKTVYLGDTYRPVIIQRLRPANKKILIGFEGYSNPESTADLRNQLVYVPTSEMPLLPEGEYYHHQLIGLRVVDSSTQVLGVLDDILETGANDVYVVKSADGNELLIPAVENFILEISLERGEIKVVPPEWD